MSLDELMRKNRAKVRMTDSHPGATTEEVWVEPSNEAITRAILMFAAARDLPPAMVNYEVTWPTARATAA